MPDEGSPSLSVKDVYGEIGTNYRYFLAWRHRLFAGYVAVLAGLSVAYWSVGDDDAFRKAIIAASFVITVVFWILEYRNRDLYHACQNSGQACESDLPQDVGIYTRLTSNTDVLHRRITQSLGIDILFFVVIVASIVVEIYLWCKG